MNNEPRADLLATVAELWRCYPDWRFGQLIANIAGWADQEIWDVEDGQLLAAAQFHLRQMPPQTASSGQTSLRSEK